MNHKTRVTGVFIIPFCDKDLERLADGISSIKYYVREPYSIICINDCVKPENISWISEKYLSDPTVINLIPQGASNWPRNSLGCLFCKKYLGVEYALANYEFDYLIGFDTDALVTGDDLFEKIAEYFEKNDPNVGLLGSYKIRADNKKRTSWEWAVRIWYLRYIKKTVNKKSLIWQKWIPAAQKNGYKLGESVLGGSFVFKAECIKKIQELYPPKLILDDQVFRMEIGEDVIFSLLTFAVKFKLADFGRPMDPMALAQKYLPLSKEKIVEQKKTIIHSTKKGLDGESEKELRAFFEKQRMPPRQEIHLLSKKIK